METEQLAAEPTGDSTAYAGVLRYYELAKRAEWQVRDLQWGEIPPIPQDVQPPKPPRNKTGKKPRNTVFDDHGDRSAADG